MPLRLIPCKQSTKRWGGLSRRRVSQLLCSCGWLLLSTTLSHRSDYLYTNWTNTQRLPHTNTSSDFKISRPLIKTDDWEQNIDCALFTIKSSAKILLPPAMPPPLPIAPPPPPSIFRSSHQLNRPSHCCCCCFIHLWNNSSHARTMLGDRLRCVKSPKVWNRKKKKWC